MIKKDKMDYTFRLETSETPERIFKTLLNVRAWWSGLYSETIEGSSNKLNDEFTFHAGDGAHYSKQKLVELVPDKKIVWLITESKLSFLEKSDEWTGSKICFEISTVGAKSEVRFTHVGLVPEIECYNACTNAWSQYLKQFLSPLLAKVDR